MNLEKAVQSADYADWIDLKAKYRKSLFTHWVNRVELITRCLICVNPCNLRTTAFFRMKRCYLLGLLCAGQMSWAQAEIYKNVDAYGHVTYSSAPSKGAKKLNLEQLPGMTAPRARNNATPPDFPKVDTSTQRTRDFARRKILENELATEEKLLAEARLNLNNEIANPEISTIKDSNSTHRPSKREERLSNLRAQVTLHESNIEALKTELRKSR